MFFFPHLSKCKCWNLRWIANFWQKYSEVDLRFNFEHWAVQSEYLLKVTGDLKERVIVWEMWGCHFIPLALIQCLFGGVQMLWCCCFGGRKGIQSVEIWVVGCWRGYVSGSRCRFAYGPADAQSLAISCSSKSGLVLPSWFYLSGVGSPG